jgi:hypothetical protein
MDAERAIPQTERNFILQQGLPAPSAEGCPSRFSALMFQPRIVGFVVLAGLISQSAALFLALSGLLWWNVVVPHLNPFDALYNRTIGTRPGAAPLPAAPAPRRFAQGMAGSFALAIGTSLVRGWAVVAYTLEAMMVLALSALLFGRFCLGSFIFYVLRGRADFARRTAPWGPGE